jgi:hypothetical protein
MHERRINKQNDRINKEKAEQLRKRRGKKRKDKIPARRERPMPSVKRRRIRKV